MILQNEGIISYSVNTMQSHKNLGPVPMFLKVFLDRIYMIYMILGIWGYTRLIELACGDFAALRGYPR